tara:strand:+ start:549 stop:746 length:198 start_codon:yes stop_codon:yes gene_type:complete
MKNINFLIKENKIYLYAKNIDNIAKFINKEITNNYILLHYNELSEYTKKLTNNGYICYVLNKSSL